MCNCMLDVFCGMAPRFVLLFTLVGTLVTLYPKFEKIKADLKDVKSKCEELPQIHNSLKVLEKVVNELKHKQREYEEVLEELRNKINLYKKDMTGLVDYAYNGRVVSIGDTETYVLEGLEILGFRIKCGDAKLETRILEVSVMPGDCWPFKGHEGSAVIELVNEIVVTKVSLEHVSRDLMPEDAITSAPLEFSLWGLLYNNGKGTPPHFFGQFVYRVSGPEVQTFAVQHPSTERFRIVELKIHSNHGHPDFTCLYRVRVHGNIPKAH